MQVEFEPLRCARPLKKGTSKKCHTIYILSNYFYLQIFKPDIFKIRDTPNYKIVLEQSTPRTSMIFLPIAIGIKGSTRRGKG